MKNITFLSCTLLMAIALFFSSCDNDNREDELFAGLNGLEERMNVLETLQDQIIAIQQLLETAERNHITSIEDVTDDSGRTGFKINFKDSDPIIIYNGVKGTDAPEISVKEDLDGVFYWTLNGEFMIVEGKKVSAMGKDGIAGVTPKLKIENNTWKVSYDGGNNYQVVEGAPTGGAGGSAITYEDKGGYFDFTINGSTISIAKYMPLTVVFMYDGTDGTSFEAGSATGGESYEISYEITGLIAGQTPIVEAIGKDGYTAQVNASAEKITITTPKPWVTGSVLVFISDGDQRTIMRSINFFKSGEGGTTINVTDDTDNQTVEYNTTSVTLKYETDIKDENLVVTIGYEGSSTGWLTQVEARVLTRTLVAKTLTFNLSENNTGDSRTAKITVGDKINTTLKQVFTLKQKAEGGDPIEVTSGNLSSILGEIVNTVASLKLAGTLNDADLATLRTMAKDKKLVTLDMSRVTNTVFSSGNINYSNLKNIVLPNNLQNINAEFLRNSKLLSIDIPASVASVEKLAFFQCTQLDNVVIRGNTKLGARSFAKCTGLTSVTCYSETVPELVSDANGSPFRGTGENTMIANLYVPSNAVDAYKNSEWSTYFNNIQAIK